MDKLKEDIELIKSSGVLDSAWYLSEYPDVAALGMDPVEHYLRLGADLLRNPSSHFDTKRYLQANRELETSGINPLVHYLLAAIRTHAPRAADAQQDADLVKGFLDRFDATGLSGWAIDPLKPGQPVELSVLVDGVEFMTLKTATARDDVSAKGMRGERAGFSAKWPAGLFNPGVSIDVQVKRTGRSLSKSPRVLEGNGEAQPRRSEIRYLEAYRDGQVLPTTVIVPIFNAYEAVADCLVSLDRHMDIDSEFLLINDCSTDPRIVGLLDQYSARPRYRVHHNPENLGYTRTVNKAIAMAAGRDVILLNSDTMVTERWLENMRYCAYAQPRVATVTALSDNAGAFSAPEMGTYNPTPEGMTPDQFARLVAHAGYGRLLEVPTGNGFCFFIRRKALDEIGDFDAQKFPRGYGEENDLCMRALRHGWLNIVTDKVYVFHKRSQSFQGEKVALMEAGSKAVNTDFPEYRTLTQRFRDAEFSLVRHRIRTAVTQRQGNAALPRIMYVISTQTGGTPQTNMDLMRAMAGKYECLLLRCDSQTITFSALVGEKLEVREVHKLSRAIDPISHRSDEYDRIVLDIMYRHSVTLLHIRHISWHSMGLAEAAKSINIPVVYSAHDFYSVCPSLNLLDENLNYCGGKCTPGTGTCQIALWPADSLPQLKHNFVGRWREIFSEFIANCDEMITTAPSAKEILANAFPDAREKITVIPHGRDFEKFTGHAKWPLPDEKVKILVPGNIGLAKGAKLITEIAALDKEGRFEFHFLGSTASILSEIGIHHGTYDRDSFASKVASIAPHVGVIFSVWPETYCHTLTEMWSCSIPVFGFDVGAVGDRIHTSGAGWPLPLAANAEQVLECLKRSLANREEFEEKLLATHAWQKTEGVWNNTATMASVYRKIYQRLLNRDVELVQKRLGLVVKGQASHPATAHIRVLKPFSTMEVVSKADSRAMSASWLLAGGLDHVDGLLIQRDAVPAQLADDLLHAIKAKSIPYIYEIDDRLWDLPKDHTDHSITEADVRAMCKLAAGATIITTSTPKLAEALQEFNPRVTVIPNGLDEMLWMQPLAEEFVQRIGVQLGLATSTTKILYMGTKSHAADLELVVEAVEEIGNAYPNVEFIQIGGGRLLPGARELKVPKEFGEYPVFVQWFRAVCTFMDIALAPLRDDGFNAAKSDIKTLDYGLGGVPAVYSRVGPYAATVIDGESGLLCENDTKAWYDSIGKLIHDRNLRRAIGQKALAIAQDRSLNKRVASMWAEVVGEIFQ